MSIRKRVWRSPSNEMKEAWVVDFTDASGKRRLKTLHTKKDAERFHAAVKAVSIGLIPEPLTNGGFRPAEFWVGLPDRAFRNGIGRAELTTALRTACPILSPATGCIVLHVIAEIPPRHIVADVDNLLKPVLDSLKGIAWMDDTQVCELLVRRIPARHRRLNIKIWQIPGPTVALHLNALAEAGHPATAKRP